MKRFDEYEVYEPIIDKDGKESILRVNVSGQNPYIPEHIGPDDIGKDQRTLRLIKHMIYDLGDFGRDWDGRRLEECLDDDIPAEFKRISDRLKALLEKSLYLMDPEDYSIVCDFVFMTYFQEYLDHIPRLVISGCTESGKTRFQKILANVCYRGEVLGDGSYASAFRAAEEYGSTIILDEFQDINFTARVDLSKMFKVGFERDGRVMRFNSTTNLTESFDVFAPMVISTQDYSDLKEDMVNRSFIVKMTEAPNNYRIDKILDKDLMAEIRHRLHHLALLCKVQARYLDDRKRDGFRIRDFLKESDCFLEGIRDDKGKFVYPQGSGIDNSCYHELKGRQFDIARSMYPMARLTGDIGPLFAKLDTMAASNRSKLRLTDFGMVMDAWIDGIRDRCPTDKQKFIKLSRSISTKAMAQICLQNGIESGEFLPTDVLKTQAMRRPLETMGFILGGGAKNRTYVQESLRYDNLLATNIRKFASPENLCYFEDLPGTIAEPTPKVTNPSKTDMPDIAITQSGVSNDSGDARAPEDEGTEPSEASE